MTSKVIQRHKGTLSFQNHSGPIYGPILIKICMNVNIMRTHFFSHKIIYDLKCDYHIMEKFCDFLL